MQNRSLSCLSSDGMRDLWKNLWRSPAKLVTSKVRNQLVAQGCKSLRMAHWKVNEYLGLN